MTEEEKMLLIFGNVYNLRDKPFALEMISRVELIFYSNLKNATIRFYLFDRYMNEFKFEKDTCFLVNNVGFEVAIDILRAFDRYRSMSDVDRLWRSDADIKEIIEE